MSDPDPLVSFRYFPVDVAREPITRFARKLRRQVAQNREFHCRITVDAELRRLNRRFLGRDYATDVLAFPGDGEFLGDLAISRQRAAAQAREQGHTTTDEMQILMLHGLLHLLGHDHESDSGQMANVERRWRRKLSLPAGLIERNRA